MMDEKSLRILLKDAAQGFYQQMYFLGKDVIHPNGNYLESYGFVKSASTGLKGTSCYTLERDGQCIELYGACAGLYTDQQQVVFLRPFCNFFHWLPEQRAVAGQWDENDIRKGKASAMLEALEPMLQWWIDYEQWIIAELGAEYRAQNYKEWKKLKSKTPWLEPELATEWVRGLLESKDHHLRPKRFKSEYLSASCFP